MCTRSSPDATTRPRFCHGSPAGTSSTSSSPSGAAHVDGDDDVRVVDRIEGATEDTEARHRDDSTDGSLTVRCMSFPDHPTGPVPVGRVRTWLRVVR